MTRTVRAALLLYKCRERRGLFLPTENTIIKAFDSQCSKPADYPWGLAQGAIYPDTDCPPHKNIDNCSEARLLELI